MATMWASLAPSINSFNNAIAYATFWALQWFASIAIATDGIRYKTATFTTIDMHRCWLLIHLTDATQPSEFNNFCCGKIQLMPPHDVNVREKPIFLLKHIQKLIFSFGFDNWVQSAVYILEWNHRLGDHFVVRPKRLKYKRPSVNHLCLLKDLNNRPAPFRRSTEDTSCFALKL